MIPIAKIVSGSSTPRWESQEPRGRRGFRVSGELHPRRLGVGGRSESRQVYGGGGIEDAPLVVSQGRAKNEYPSSVRAGELARHRLGSNALGYAN